MLDRRDIRRLVYEIVPESLTDRIGYEQYREYLMRGKNGTPRAGVAMEMEPLGYKVFVLPPGQAARLLGYKGDAMIAVLRKKT